MKIKIKDIDPEMVRKYCYDVGICSTCPYKLTKVLRINICLFDFIDHKKNVLSEAIEELKENLEREVEINEEEN